MSSGGILWFSNILIPDPTGIIPIVCAFSQVINIWLM
jgi:membrane protein insertase Oxa1/YidC/SpoIIIJ